MFRTAVWSAVRIRAADENSERNFSGNRKRSVSSVRMRSAHKIYGGFAPKKVYKKERGEGK